jgi:hypothetical protein
MLATSARGTKRSERILSAFCRPTIDEPGVVLAFVKAQLGVAFAPALILKRIHEQGLLALHLTNPTCERTLGIA